MSFEVAADAYDRFSSAEDPPYPDGTFDVTVTQLAVHLMMDPVAGLAEMARVTSAGAVVAAGRA